MDELLKKLLEAEILSPETKQELETSIQSKLNEAIEQAKAQATADVTAQLNEQWITERDILIETLDEKVTEALEQELMELKEDVERFRDLEVEYEAKLVDAKHGLAEQLKEDMKDLVQRIDAFVEIKLNEELSELKEDIEATRKNEFGRKVFEAFMGEFKTFYTADDSVEGKLNETTNQLNDAMTALAEAEQKIATFERNQKMRAVLAPLTGRHREVMEAILKSVDTAMLEEAYNTYIARVLKETSQADGASEKEDKVLAEGKESKDSINGVVKTGDDATALNEAEDIQNSEAVVEESVKPRPAITPEERARLRALAGMA